MKLVVAEPESDALRERLAHDFDQLASAIVEVDVVLVVWPGLAETFVVSAAAVKPPSAEAIKKRAASPARLTSQKYPGKGGGRS